MVIVKSLFYFVLAGLCEIGGGYLVWLWLRENKGLWLALVVAVVLILYGIIPTFQPAHFGSVYDKGFGVEDSQCYKAIDRQKGPIWDARQLRKIPEKL